MRRLSVPATFYGEGFGGSTAPFPYVVAEGMNETDQAPYDVNGENTPYWFYEDVQAPIAWPAYPEEDET